MIGSIDWSRYLMSRRGTCSRPRWLDGALSCRYRRRGRTGRWRLILPPATTVIPAVHRAVPPQPPPPPRIPPSRSSSNVRNGRRGNASGSGTSASGSNGNTWRWLKGINGRPKPGITPRSKGPITRRPPRHRRLNRYMYYVIPRDFLFKWPLNEWGEVWVNSYIWKIFVGPPHKGTILPK